MTAYSAALIPTPTVSLSYIALKVISLRSLQLPANLRSRSAAPDMMIESTEPVVELPEPDLPRPYTVTVQLPVIGELEAQKSVIV